MTIDRSTRAHGRSAPPLALAAAALNTLPVVQTINQPTLIIANPLPTVTSIALLLAAIGGLLAMRRWSALLFAVAAIFNATKFFFVGGDVPTRFYVFVAGTAILTLVTFTKHWRLMRW